MVVRNLNADLNHRTRLILILDRMRAHNAIGFNGVTPNTSKHTSHRVKPVPVHVLAH